jgi:hypothetical protein
MEFILPMVITVSFFAMIAWIVYVIVDGKRRRERLKVFTDFHGKLMDRMTSPAEFGAFMQSPGGQRFLATLQTERGGPKVAIMRSVHTGTIMLALSIGLLFLQRLDLWNSEARAFVVFMGVIVLALGVGFLVSAGLSWRLGRSLGVMDDEWTPPRDVQSR